MISGTTARRALVLALLVGAIACLLAAAHQPATPKAHAGHAAATPLWSPRRAPQSVVDAVGDDKLGAQVANATRGTNACFLVRDGARTVVAQQPDTALTPASTQKLVTATAALHDLGPQFHYETKVVAAAKPVNGSIDKLWLVGGGDPGLATAARIAKLAADPLTSRIATTPLAKLADSIVTAGVTAIPGGVHGDDSRYGTQRMVPTWDPSDRFESGPLGALAVDEGVDRATGGQVADPALDAAQRLSALLAARGVQVGPAGHDSAPGGTTTIASITSPPLQDVIEGALLASDNYVMEMVNRELGVHDRHDGTTPAGTESVTKTVTDLGLPVPGLHLVDGSGLDDGNRVSCTTLLSTLERNGDPNVLTLLAGLPVAGKSGTLFDRFAGTPLAGHLRAKTGTLTGATGLVGFEDLTRPLAFAFVANGRLSQSAAIALRERVATILSHYPDAPPADELVPAPATPG